jgi:hypothetical protein
MNEFNDCALPWGKLIVHTKVSAINRIPFIPLSSTEQDNTVNSLVAVVINRINYGLYELLCELIELL